MSTTLHMLTGAETRTHGLAAANLAAREAVAAGEQRAAARRQARKAIEAIDAVLEAVEQHHLSRRPRNVPLHPTWRTHLEESGGLTIPLRILQLQNTRRLHEALMDWQEQLFDEVVPERAEYRRGDEERIPYGQIMPLQRPIDRPYARPTQPTYLRGVA